MPHTLVATRKDRIVVMGVLYADAFQLDKLTQSKSAVHLADRIAARNLSAFPS